MELFEKINRAFGGWYEGLFGSGDDVRPKDVLRRILTTLEENRKEGFDSKVYVPNQYILEITVNDPEEKEYLLSFLDREELESVVRRYCQQNNFHIRGALDFTIKEVAYDPEKPPAEKVRVRCRYDSRLAGIKDVPKIQDASVEAENAAVFPVESGHQVSTEPEEDATIAQVSFEEDGTVPAISLAHIEVKFSVGDPISFNLSSKPFTIGRSPKLGNDLVLHQDGMASRRHARIEYEPDGRFTIYDLQTTNGTLVNGRTIDNVTLNDGDEIVIGATRIIFMQTNVKSAPTAPQPLAGSADKRSASLVLTDGERDLNRFLIGMESVIGRGITNDVVLDDRSVATRHAVVICTASPTLEVLAPDHLTLLNGAPLETGDVRAIQSGDRIGIGTLTLRFEGAQA